MNLLYTENVLLPKEAYCRLSFLQKIITDKKRCLIQDQVKDHNIHHNWPEFATKHCYPLVKNNRKVLEYLPDDEMDQGRHPDKEFFWKICHTVIPEWADRYREEMVKQRNLVKQDEFRETKKINVTDAWLSRMKKHDFKSQGKWEFMDHPLFFIARKKTTHSVLIR